MANAESPDHVPCRSGSPHAVFFCCALAVAELSSSATMMAGVIPFMTFLPFLPVPPIPPFSLRLLQDEAERHAHHLERHLHIVRFDDAGVVEIERHPAEVDRDDERDLVTVDLAILDRH